MPIFGNKGTMHLQLRVWLVGCLALSGCAHVVNFEDVGYRFRFVGGRLNGASVERDTTEVGAFRFKTESSFFVYEVDQAASKAGTVAWNNLQAAFSIVPAEESQAWALTRDDLSGFSADLVAALVQRVPHTTCGAPESDGQTADAPMRVRCTFPAGEATVQVVLQTRAGPRGLLVQWGSWSTANDKGRVWVDGFLQSAQPLPAADSRKAPAVATAWPADASLAALVVQRALATR